MKNIIKGFGCLLMFLLLTTGCGTKKDAKVILEEALNNMKDIKSMAVNMDINMGIKAEGLTLNMQLDVEGMFDEKNNTYMKMNMSFIGYNQTEETYVINTDGFTYNYTNNGEGWEYTKVEYKEPELLSQEEKEKNIDKLLEMIKDVKEEKTDKKGYTKLIVTIDGVKMNEAVIESGEDIEVGLESDFVLIIYIKNGYIEIIEADISDLTSRQMLEDEMGTDMKLNTKMTVQLSKFNKIDKVVLPKEVEENAVSDSKIEVEFDNF